jgi:hypothetical protein
VATIRRIGYWGALASIFAVAAWLRSRVPADPIADRDTWGYLSPALSKLTGGEFGHTYRNFIYPGFLFLLLRAFGDFRAINVAQHFLGLIAGAILLLTWRRARIFASELRVGYDIHNALGLLAAVMFLWSAEPINAETQLRPEGVCAFLRWQSFHSLQNPRYMTVQVFFTILAQFLALWFILEFVLQVLTAEKTSRPERNPRNLRLRI